MLKVKIKDAINVSNAPGSNYPFNLKFSTKLTGPKVQGAGVYIICFNGEPVYLGKYQPLNRNNIFNDRWLRHLETFTLRGSRVGFGPKSSADAIKPTLDPALYQLLCALPEHEKVRCFRDTGVCASKSRRAFASAHWSEFSQRTKDNVLDGFSLYYYKVSGLKDEQQARAVVTALEEQIIRQFNFQLNSASGLKNTFSLAGVESTIQEYMESLQGLSIAKALVLEE